MSSTFYKISSIIAIAWMFLFTSPAFGNDLYINQSGDNFDLDIIQNGSGNNLIRGYHNQTASLVGSNNKLKITQYQTINTSTFSTAHVDINGNNNDIFMGMGVGTTNFNNFTNTDSQEAGNHNQKLYLQGSNNDVYMLSLIHI